MTEADQAALANIYNSYVPNTTITFETDPVSPQQMWDRVSESMARALPWLVAVSEEQVVGYAYAAPWKTRRAYRFSVEVTIYLHPDVTNRGIGSTLYEQLFAVLRANGHVHAVMAGIALPNLASIALHEKCGMRKVGHLHEVGYKLQRWIDVGYWQLIL